MEEQEEVVEWLLQQQLQRNMLTEIRWGRGFPRTCLRCLGYIHGRLSSFLFPVVHSTCKESHLVQSLADMDLRCSCIEHIQHGNSHLTAGSGSP